VGEGDLQVIGGPTAWSAGEPVAVHVGFAALPSDVVEDVDRILAAAPVPAPPAAAHADEPTERRPFARFVWDHIAGGSGVLVLHDLPVDPADPARCEAALSALLAACGSLLPQNVAGDAVYTVIDRSDPRGRLAGGSRSTGPLLHHTDQAAAPEPLLAHLLALWCLTPARSGGETILASGHALHDALLAHDRRLVAALHEPVPFARDDDGTSDADPVRSPVFQPRGGMVRVRYNEYFVRRGVDRTGEQLTRHQRAALDACEAILATGRLDQVVPLGAGDLLLVDNRFVMHNRTAYEDRDDPARKRRLLRGWARSTAIPARRAGAAAGAPR
jgi:hypothetical protein